MATKANGKSPVSSTSANNVVFFRDISLGPHETQLRFRLIHFWEAWNPIKKTLIGLEMLLIDEHGTVIQGFILPGRIEKYLYKMKRGSVYKLDNFYRSSNKSVYRVSEHAVTVSFSWNSDLAVLLDNTTPFDENRFQFHSYESFDANRDLKGDLYDVVGHMKLVNGQSLIEPPVLDEVEIAKARHVLVHVQSHRLGSNPEIVEQVNAEVVTKREPLTIGEIFSYMKQESAKVNGNQGVDHEVPVPEALISTIGQRHKFCVKVMEHNLSGKTRSLTVTKILSLATRPATKGLEGNHNTAALEETFETGNNVCEASKSRVDSSEGRKRTCDSAEIEVQEGSKGPIFEDDSASDSAFNLFPGKDGLVPLSGYLSFGDDLQDQTNSAFCPGEPFRFGPFSDKFKKQHHKKPNKQHSGDYLNTRRLETSKVLDAQTFI
ncbi:hypothetical protein Bca52824_016149 [Brassica carinata]|uniref:Replication protein A 70 kDa DNA-binding subunit B/D first OB fold domain-containing protein n=1 Tax=Brassica carinata TaxID=52824 RepID=A0A8X7W3Y6_BRACI|nr:hypothetical protein Bca52824_016149 [Brassica carinata]